MNRLTIVLLALVATVVHAQDQTRQIWDTGFRQKRPSRPPGSGSSPGKEAAPEYRMADKPGPAPEAPAPPIGFTLWRLQPASSGDRARLLVQDSASARPSELTQVRVRADVALAQGDRVRLGIEVPTHGYLYVVDRELLSDGSRGTPYLVFPAKNLRGGDNRVEPGRLIEIPAQSDRVPALVITRQHANYRGEELTVIVTPDPIPGLPLQDRETPLDPDLVSAWEARWGGPTRRLELAGAVGRWTDEEQQAGLGKRLLTQADPMPQALYQGTSRNGALLVRIPLVVE